MAMRCMTVFKMNPLMVRRSSFAASRITSASSLVQRTRSAVRLAFEFSSFMLNESFLCPLVVSALDYKPSFKQKFAQIGVDLQSVP